MSISLAHAQPVADLESFLTASRRYLHQHPEVGFNEFETSRYIWNTLEKNGFTVYGPVAGTGLYVDIEGSASGSLIGYRADIDALPIHDAKHVPYTSQNPGVAHLCGHDVHATMAMGVALSLKERRDLFTGTIRVFFQPAEETVPSGAPLMIEDGILNDMEAVYAVHVDPTLPTGTYGLIKGAATAAAVRFTVRVSSESTGHSARPHEAIDTIWHSTQILNQFYQLTGRFSDPRDATIITVCRFHGGDALNVIPSEVEFGGTLRSTSLETRHHLQRLMTSIAQSQGRIGGADIEVFFDEGVPPVLNDPRLIDHISDVIVQKYGIEAVHWIQRPSMGGEDFANYQQYIPGALIRVGTSCNQRTSYPLHDAHFDVDETAVAPAVALISEILISHTTKALL